MLSLCCSIALLSPMAVLHICRDHVPEGVQGRLPNVPQRLRVSFRLQHLQGPMLQNLFGSNQRPLTLGEASSSYTCVASLTGLDSVASLHTNNNIFSCLVESNPVKLKTSSKVFLHQLRQK